MKPRSILTIIATTAMLTAGCSGPSKKSDQSTKLQLIPQGSLSDGHFLGDIYNSAEFTAVPKSRLNGIKGFDATAFMSKHRDKAPDMGQTIVGGTTNESTIHLKDWLNFRFGKSAMDGVSVTATNVVTYTLSADVFDTEIHPRHRWNSPDALTGKYYVSKLMQASEGVLTFTNTSSTGGHIEADKALKALASGGVQVTKRTGQNYHFKLKAPTFIYNQMERIAKDAPYALKDIPGEPKTFNYKDENKHYLDRHRRFGAPVNIDTKVWLSLTDSQIVVNAKSDVHAVVTRTTRAGAEPRIRLEIENGTSQVPIPFKLPGHLKDAELQEPRTHLTELKAFSVIPSRPFIRNQNDQRDIHVTRDGPVADWASFDPFEVEGDTGGPKPGFTVRLTPLVIKAQITTGKQ